MAFITTTDFPASIHADILNALTRGDNTVITDNVDRTVDEMKAYLNARYNTTAIFTAAGDARNKFLLRLALNITIYNICLVHCPRKLTQVIIDQYERAIEILKDIRKGVMNPEGLPTPAVTDPTSNSGNGAPVQWGSDEPYDSSY